MIENLPIMYRDDDVKEWCAPDIIAAVLATLPGIETAYDFGCGRGVYVQAFHDANIGISGYDNNRAEIIADCICAERNYNVDLRLPLEYLRQADLIFSIETAEHIEPSCLDTFIDNLIRLSSKWIVFTGSDKPNSPGHVNPQSNEYWRGRIVSRGTHKYRADLSQVIMESCKTIIGRPSCLRWFQENLQVFESIV